MRNVKRQNIVIMVFISILCVIVIMQSICAINDINSSEVRRQEIAQKCKLDLENKENLDEVYVDYCENVIYSSMNLKVDFYTALSEIILYRVRFLNVFGFLAVIIPTLIAVCNILKNKYIINALTRESYVSFLKQFFKKAYRFIWILPLLAIIMFTFCGFNTTFDTGYAIYNKSSIWTSSLINHPFWFMFIYIINLVMYSITYVNISLIVARKQHRYVLTVILAFLLFLGIELFLEIVVNILICNIILHEYNIGVVINIMNLFTFNDILGIDMLLLFTILVTIISTIIVILLYRNKEKLVISCEKNNRR